MPNGHFKRPGAITVPSCPANSGRRRAAMEDFMSPARVVNPFWPTLHSQRRAACECSRVVSPIHMFTPLQWQVTIQETACSPHLRLRFTFMHHFIFVLAQHACAATSAGGSFGSLLPPKSGGGDRLNKLFSFGQVCGRGVWTCFVTMVCLRWILWPLEPSACCPCVACRGCTSPSRWLR